MPVDYKLRSLRRLFGAHSFFVKPGAAAGAFEAPGAGRGGAQSSGRGGGGGAPPPAPGGVPRAFFSEMPPRAVRNKAVAGQLNIVHLFEKQKMRVYYGCMRDSKFKMYVDEAQRKRFNTDAALSRLLELRLDTMLYRTGFVQTPSQARQWICHNLVSVNDEAVNVKSFRMRPGDVLSIADKHVGHALVASKAVADMRHQLGIGASWIVTSAAPEGMLPWFEIDRVGLSATLVREPTDDEMRGLRNAALFPFIRDAQLNPHAAMRAYR